MYYSWFTYYKDGGFRVRYVRLPEGNREYGYVWTWDIYLYICWWSFLLLDA